MKALPINVLAMSGAARIARMKQPPRPGDRLKVENATVWRSDDLRALFSRLCESVGVSKRRTVRVVYTRGSARGSSGYATYHSRALTVRLARPQDGEAILGFYAKRELACTFLHEVEHNLGLRHSEMMDGCRSASSTRNARADGLPWLTEIVVRVKLPASKPSREERVASMMEKRTAKAEKQVVVWTRKLKLAQTKLKVWKKKARHYEKRAAARPVASQMSYVEPAGESGAFIVEVVT